ncbi:MULTISPECIES: tachylectin-related carbohydrate-binding protein [unclassified Streptomyces]|uniref:tachylectin-related carbohydrate-binding protein n=1 Tax=unclassified Streptomyces TaxID=2593676 RepID=UPI002DDC1319|nr:tachylectin-related carbohydrate-binding protein [Streptomyces sp. NBC_01750]WSB02371.1 tachylectin-related carbohydrate-binding protein [Streptomyces sp. NBC_01794]WSD33360.1 tachylectin-related carbohydrate-binding protein [Streptomyces sp. NBC_01750]
MTRISPRAHIRRTALTAALAVAVPVLVALPAGTAQAANAPVTCTTTGPTYTLDPAGKLYRQDMPTPMTGAALPNGSVIDSTWTGYGQMMAGPAATFYGIKSDGLYYSHRISASATWDVHHKKISSGFTEFKAAGKTDEITIDRGGYIWTLAGSTGGLRWYKYDAAAGDFITGSGKIVDMGWDRYDAIYAADKGVIYGRSATDGKLYRSRYDVTSQRWIERHVLESAADWSDSKTITSFGGDTLFRVKGNGAVTYYRFDEGIRDFPVYNKQLEASGWAAFTSVSGAPDACRIDVNHTPASPSVPLENYSRASVMQSSAGSLELAYTDNIGRLVHGRMGDPNDINGVQWTTISGNEAFSGQPTLAEHTDGRVVVTGHNTSGSVWQRNQTAKSGADWGNWIDLAGAMAQHAVTARTPSGLLVQFSADADGKPWYRIQQRANVDFMGWTPLAGSGFTGPFTAVTVRDGIQLFGKNASGVLSTALFKEAGSLSSWSSLGAQAVTGTPTVVIYPGYRLRVFATDGLGKVVTTAQSAEGSTYGEWSTVEGLTANGSPSAVISPLTGLTEIVVRGEDGYTYNTGETVQGSGTWRTWQQASFEASATEPTAFTYTNATGPTWAYSFRTADNQTRVYQVQQTSSLSAMRAGDKAPAFTGRALPRP